MRLEDCLIPDWPAPPNVRALATTRAGGTSRGPFASLNLGEQVGDDPAAVAENRRRLHALLPAAPVWLKQVHGTRCVDAACAPAGSEADAAFSRTPGFICAVLTADCLPVLLCDRAGTVVAAAHAGWRGLAAGILEATVAAMNVPAHELLAWLGPAIGPEYFEVGSEVREAFLEHDPAAASAFWAKPAGKWHCDLYALARQRLAKLGVSRLFSADSCTYRDRARFFSYRRDGVTGRQASLIWIEPRLSIRPGR